MTDIINDTLESLSRQAIVYVLSNPIVGKANSYPQIVKRCVNWVYWRTTVLDTRQDIKPIVIKELNKLDWEKEFKPQTEIASKLLSIRIEYILNGGKLYTCEEINE